MIILSLVVCASVAIFCFASGLPLAGFLMLLGMIPGIGYLPLVIAAIILALSGHPVAAVCAVLVIVYNLWVVVALRR